MSSADHRRDSPDRDVWSQLARNTCTQGEEHLLERRSHLERVQLIVNHGHMNRCLSLVIQSNIVHAVIQKEFHRIQRVVLHRMVQRRPAILVFHVQVYRQPIDLYTHTSQSTERIPTTVVLLDDSENTDAIPSGRIVNGTEASNIGDLQLRLIASNDAFEFLRIARSGDLEWPFVCLWMTNFSVTYSNDVMWTFGEEADFVCWFGCFRHREGRRHWTGFYQHCR